MEGDELCKQPSQQPGLMEARDAELLASTQTIYSSDMRLARLTV
jgi:hypothetical protein